MRSAYAVYCQIFVSAINFIIFLVFTNNLSPDQFVLFSTAVGLSVLAYAVAEGGISYVAPKALSNNDYKGDTAKLAGAFISISIIIYTFTTLVGYYLWGALSNDPLSAIWVVCYVCYFFPVMILPSWATFKSIKLPEVMLLTLTRLGGVAYLWIVTSYISLACVALFNGLISLIIIYRINNTTRSVALPSHVEIKASLGYLKEVFLSKTLAYSIYSLLPLVIAAAYGNSASAIYVLGERLKSMYTTIVQPIIQIVYLKFCGDNAFFQSKMLIGIVSMLSFNFVLVLTVYLAFRFEVVFYFFERFRDIGEYYYYILAAFTSVSSAVILYFYILPNSMLKVFRASTFMQVIVFILLFAIMTSTNALSPALVLFLGELALLMSILFFIFQKKNGEN